MFEVRACAEGKISRDFEPSLEYSLGFISVEKLLQKTDRLQFVDRARDQRKRLE